MMADDQENSQELRLGKILNEYKDLLAEGQAPSETQFLAQYPELADQLRSRLSLVRALGGADKAGARMPQIPGYELLEEVGRGGMGVVFKAHQRHTHRMVAIKIMRDAHLADAERILRFEREVKLAANLSHPNIVTIHDSGVAEGQHYLVMQYAVGKPLDEYVTQACLNPSEILRLFSRICRAVGYAHAQNVIHRDLKPSNVLVHSSDEFQILDFGLARQLTDPDTLQLSVDGQVLGTVPYMSPEQTKGIRANVDARTDVYSLGVMLYALLTLQHPYDTTDDLEQALRNIRSAQPPPPSSLQSHLPAQVDSLVLRAIEKLPARRYANATEFAEAIDATLGSASGRFASTHGLVRATGFIMLLFVALVLALLWHQGHRTAVSSAPSAEQVDVAQSQPATLEQAGTRQMSPNFELLAPAPISPPDKPVAIAWDPAAPAGRALDGMVVSTAPDNRIWEPHATLEHTAKWLRPGTNLEQDEPPSPQSSTDRFNLYFSSDLPGFVYVVMLHANGELTVESADLQQQSACVPKRSEGAASSTMAGFFGTYQLNDPPGAYEVLAFLADVQDPELCGQLIRVLSPLGSRPRSDRALDVALAGQPLCEHVLAYTVFRYTITSQ